MIVLVLVLVLVFVLVLVLGAYWTLNFDRGARNPIFGHFPNVGVKTMLQKCPKSLCVGDGRPPRG